MKTQVCANFAKCKIILKAEDPRVKIKQYTYCEPCATERAKVAIS